MKSILSRTIAASCLSAAGFLGSTTFAVAQDRLCNESVPDPTAAIPLSETPQAGPRLGSFNIVLVPGAGLSGNAPALAAFQRAADQWEAYFSDPITITINADVADLDTGVAGSTSCTMGAVSYTSARTQLMSDAADESDDDVMASLPTSMSFDLPDSFTALSTVQGCYANFRALGYNVPAGSDGTILFNTDYQANWDFDRSDGIGGSMVDFEGVAAHEIGHLLGFTSIVTYIDSRKHDGFTSDAVPALVMDVLRFRNDTAADPSSTSNFNTYSRSMRYGTDDITDDLVYERRMSTGTYYGDSYQPSHWKYVGLTGTYIGLMDPVGPPGTILDVYDSDARLLDLIGYDWEPCGDGDMQYPYETCDDSNRNNGDCCNSDCQLDAYGTGCTADANACTIDICNASGGCIHLGNTGASCNDGLFCNGPDSCNNTACTNHSGNPCTGNPECNNVCNEAADTCQVANGTACTSDSNGCTNDVCASGACAHQANTLPCNDGLFCNGADTCGGGTCSVHVGDPCSAGAECNNSCNETVDNCLSSAGTACTADANACTNDACNGSGSCTHPNNTAACDDGLFCNGTDTCSGGTCSVHGTDPCAGGGDCSDSCNEADGSCADPADTACTDDGDICTTDTCDGSGSCLHTYDQSNDPSCLACPDEPDIGCFAPGKFSLQVSSSTDAAKNKIGFKWQKGEPVAFADFGTPSSSTTYRLCIWSTDGFGTVTTLSAAAVDVTAGWTDDGTKKMQYKEKTGAEDGITQIKLGAGELGKSSVMVKGKGSMLDMPGPFAADRYFDPTLSIIVQLASSEGKCWGGVFLASGMKVNDGTKAKTTDEVVFCGDGIRDLGEVCDGEDNLACGGSGCDGTCFCNP